MKELFIVRNFRNESLTTIDLVNAILDEYAGLGFDLSLRQLYYQMVARGYIENSLRSYKNLGNLVNDARLAGLVDWEMIVDRNRETVAVAHWDNPGEIIDVASRQFRVDKWVEQPYHVEVMVEKDALSGVLSPVCRGLDISLTANKGYPSSSILYEMSKRLQAILDHGKEIYILHLGDHDPSGIDMTRDLRDRLALFTREDISIERLALNMDQVRLFNPPENPAKTTDSRYRAYIVEFGKSSWELDALEPRVLAGLVSSFVLDLRDEDLWSEAVAREKAMREELESFASKYGENGTQNR